MRKFGLAPQTLPDIGPLEFLHCAAEAQYDFVGLRLASPSGELSSVSSDLRHIREIAKALADTDLVLNDVEYVRVGANFDPIAGLAPFFENTSALGARRVLTVCEDLDLSRAAENLARLANLAHQYSLELSLEPLPWTSVSSPLVANELIDATGSDGIGILVDALHYFRAGCLAGDLKGIPSGRLHAVQLCDATSLKDITEAEYLRRARADRLLPGEGELDLEGLVRSLPDTLMVSVESPVAASAARPAQERADRALAALHEVVTRAEAGS